VTSHTRLLRVFANFPEHYRVQTVKALNIGKAASEAELDLRISSYSAKCVN
jgi:hypothetical protein